MCPFEPFESSHPLTLRLRLPQHPAYSAVDGHPAAVECHLQSFQKVDFRRIALVQQVAFEYSRFSERFSSAFFAQQPDQ